MKAPIICEHRDYEQSELQKSDDHIHSKAYEVLPAFNQRIDEIHQVGQAYQAEYPAFARVEIRLVALIAFQAEWEIAWHWPETE